MKYARKLGFSLLGLIVIGALAGCGGKKTAQSGETPETADKAGAPPSGAKKAITICLLPKKKGLPYFSSCADGAREAAR